jgi:regulator of PEP synthase PpsR (kinase-PPPase family)
MTTKPATRAFNIHLVSDSTGETVTTVARACLVQFNDLKPSEFIWPLIRTRAQIEEVIAGIVANPGFVLFTLVNREVRAALEEGCRVLQVPCVAMLDPIFSALGHFLGSEMQQRPGRQHVLDAEYFERIDAMQYVLGHDDGQATGDLELADVILVGVSRSSKTPTCIYLANRGVRAANVPVVPGVPLPEAVMTAKRPLVVGLTKEPKRLIQIRRSRLRMISEDAETDYVDPERVYEEVMEARRLFAQHGWPVIDVTRRSVEETAASILQMLKRRKDAAALAAATPKPDAEDTIPPPATPAKP